LLRNEGDRLTRVVVSTPESEYFRVANLEAHHMNEEADREKTRQQHGHLKSILSGFGCEVIDAPELAGHPNSVFTRDVALSTPHGYLKLRMGLETRRGEEEWMSQILQSVGEPCAGEIRSPGTVEGGDVILAGSVAFVGLSRRTNEEGAQQISRLLADMDYEVRQLPVPDGVLHLGGVLSAIGPERLLCCRGVLEKGFDRGFDAVEVPPRGPSTGNVICLEENEVIANVAENQEAIGILEGQGVKVHGVDLSEFRKGAGGPTCLVLPLDRR
jgi:dimethylargininase